MSDRCTLRDTCQQPITHVIVWGRAMEYQLVGCREHVELEAELLAARKRNPMRNPMPYRVVCPAELGVTLEQALAALRVQRELGGRS